VPGRLRAGKHPISKEGISNTEKAYSARELSRLRPTVSTNTGDEGELFGNEHAKCEPRPAITGLPCQAGVDPKRGWADSGDEEANHELCFAAFDNDGGELAMLQLVPFRGMSCCSSRGP
jgi:hypothetical protein